MDLYVTKEKCHSMYCDVPYDIYFNDNNPYTAADDPDDKYCYHCMESCKLPALDIFYGKVAVNADQCHS